MSFRSFSQTDKFLYYFDKNLNTTTKAKSVFTGIGSTDSGLVKLNCFINRSGELMLSAYFTDSTLTINHGLFQSYYRNGYKESEGNYAYNIKVGNWKKWDSLGYIIDSSIFENGLKILSDTFTYHENGLLETDKMEDKKNDKFRNVKYDENGKVLQEATFIGQSGVLKYKTDDGFKIDSVFTREEIETSFPGGAAAWNRFMKQAMERNLDKITDAHNSGTCRIKFSIDKDGSICDVEAVTMKGTVFAKLMVEEVKKSPKWIPAKQYGRNVKAFREQPVSFTMMQ